MNEGYTQALVMFIDVLGSQNRIKFKELYDINKIFHEQMEYNQKQDKKHTAYERFIYTFSDCSYIIYNFKKDTSENKRDVGSLCNVALYNTQFLIQKFLLAGFICRGGVSFGDVYYETGRSLLFGPAINKAYELESKKAIYPRILIDDCVAEQIIEHNRSLIENCQPSEREYIAGLNGDIVLRDAVDNLFHFNYLCSVKQGFDFMIGNRVIENAKEIINKERAIWGKKIIMTTQEKEINLCKKVLLKYDWLERYIEESVPSQDMGASLAYLSD